MRQILLAMAGVCIFAFGLQAQGEFSGGFKTGLNFNSFDGPLEAGESYGNNVGFHIGATFLYSVTDLFGLKGELLYSQKGSQYNYEGDSYFVFYTTSGENRIFANGRRQNDISVANSYIDIPLMVYYRIGPVELEAGVNAAVMIGSVGSGGITFSGSTPQGATIAEFTTTAEYSYYRDESGLASIRSSENINLGVENFLLPTEIGAYYEGPNNDTKRFNRLDFGLNAGIAFFLNQGLYIGGRLNYGLADITRTEQDIDYRELGPDNEYITRDDMDRNLSIQASVGFRF
jgi:hypothetical protein